MEKIDAFDSLAKPVRRLVTERGFGHPTGPQSEAIPIILEGKNLLLIAPAGTGKTEAALLPILHMLLSTPREKGIKVTYITPLRALNRDLLDRLEWWCRALDLKISVRHGDTTIEERKAQSLSPPDIMVTTPETLQILLVGRRLSRYLTTVRWVIVDEIHELAENKRGSQLSLSLERLRRVKGGDFQLIGLSATIGSPEEIAKFLVGVGRECEVKDISVARKVETEVYFPTPSKADETLASQLYTYPPVAARLRSMRGLIEEHKSTLVFTNTRPTAEVLTNRFRIWDLDFPVRAHHGSLSGPTRLRAEQDMKSGNLKAIVCTSSLELGIDIGAIDYCIQYGSPRQVTRFLQRVGRSGHRVDETAKGAMVAQDQDDALESIVIKARSRKRILEPIETPEKPYDVLMHGLTAMMIVERRWDVDEALLLVRKAYPFKDLSKEELVEVLRFMQDLGLARLSEGGNIFSRPPRYERVFSYYFQNLSMIPRMRQYLVVNDEDEMPVGILDEEFVVEYGEPGTKFVMGGLVWNIVQVFGNKVYVRGDENPVGAIPSWIGEEIPVPFSIAQEVGRIRGRVEEIAKEGCPLGSIVEEVAREYEVRQGTVAEAVQSTFAHYKRGIPTPTNNRIVIENFRDLIVIHAHLGTLVNRTLALFIVYMVSRMMFEAKATLIDPYRIVLRSEVVEPEDLVEMMRRPDVDLGEAVREIVEGSKFFEWRMIQVARRMGVVEEEAKMASSVIDKLVRGLRGTPAFEEAFKEVAHKDLNPKEALTVLRKIRDGEIEVTSTGRLSEASPISDGIVKLHEKLLEPVTQDRVRLLAVASAKARLLSKVTTFICNECERYVEDKMVGTLPERPQCPKCGSYSLGMVEEPPERVKQMLLKTRKGVRRDKVLAEISSTSKLISRYGKPAAVALAGSGITPSLAEEVLKEGDWSTGKFYETVLEKERRALAQKFRWI